MSIEKEWPRLACRRCLIALTVALCLVLEATFQIFMAQPAAPLPAPAGAGNPLSLARSWGYQLQGVDPSVIATSPYDVVVIDYSRDGSDWRSYSPGEIARMKVKPDGGRRIVLCYFSIGEAESNRYYWRKRWSWMSWGGWRWFWQLSGERFLPSWVGPQNAEWKGNFGVRYWQSGWQDIIVNGEDSYLQRIVRAGFDGAYLDKIDEYVDMSRENARARPEMIALVARLAKKARELSPGFLVVPQNGEELLRDAGYRAVIDGLGKEDFLFGDPKDKVRNATDIIAKNARDLQLLIADRKPVFAVEYLRDPQLIGVARQQLVAQGFVPHFADRPLDNLRMGDIPTNARENRKR
jgi:cysteinyl-tRNA synthetase, unknown class